MLQANKFNRESVIDIAGYAGSRFAEGNQGTECGPLVAGDAGA